GDGTIESVNSIQRDDLVQFHKTWVKPNNSKLIVVGDITEDRLRGLLEKYFKSWKPGKVLEKNIAPVELPRESVVYIMDKPQSPQSLIIAGHVAIPKDDPDEIAVDAVNRILGGTFTSRINMNIREDKHWSYGARSLILDAKGQAPFIVYAPVQIDKTADAMLEILDEIRGILGEKPITLEELDKTKKNMILSLPGTWETSRSILNSLAEIVTYGLPDDYYRAYLEIVNGLSLEKLQEAARKVLHPEKLTWVVVGDKEKVEKQVKSAGFEKVYIIDTEGNVIQ
ncbi:MAG: insulinase family protein, partial [Candidatus Neomarinimicrobiota bacterium]